MEAELTLLFLLLLVVVVVVVVVVCVDATVGACHRLVTARP
jgi:hypothetical protein